MSMTKKDFEALAAALRPALNGPIMVHETGKPTKTIQQEITLALLDFCQAQNPKFDAERFTRALLKAPAPKSPPTVYVHVEGGAVSIGKPRGVAVEVVDFDTDGAESAELCDGHNCEVHKDHRHECYDAASVEVL